MARTRRTARRSSDPQVNDDASKTMNINEKQIAEGGSLRGFQYKKVPSLPSSGNGGSKPTKDYTLFPTEITDHPAPYFKSPAVDFGKITEKPWESAPKKPTAFGDSQLAAIATAVGDDVINEVVQDELMATGVEVMEENVIKSKADKANADYAEDELLTPVLNKEADKVAWETLDFWIRTYGDDEKYKQLPEVDVTTQVAISAYARGEKPSSKLRFLTWDVLIPHIRKAKQGKGLTQNLALLSLQKAMVTKVATDALQKSAASSMEAEIKAMEEKEKLTTPPRRG